MDNKISFSYKKNLFGEKLNLKKNPYFYMECNVEKENKVYAKLDIEKNKGKGIFRKWKI